MPLIPPDAAELFESGVSILVGTRDANFVPEATRAVGALVHRDRERLTVFLPTAVSERTLSNLRDNGRIAVGFAGILDHRALQVKGRVDEIRDATEAERAIVMQYQAAFGEILCLTGIPRTIVRQINAWPSTAVTLTAAELFVQTPGPKAGERLTP